MKRLMVVLLSLTMSCTVIFPAVTAGTIAMHNGIETDQWNYGTPTLTALVLGLVTDIAVISWFFKNAPGFR